MQTKELQYFKLFRDVCKVINSSLDFKEVLNLITENIVAVLDVKACTIFLWDKRRNTLEVSSACGLSEAYLKKGRLDADKSIAETLEGKTVIILDPASDPRVQYPEEAKVEGIASLLSIPVKVIFTSSSGNSGDAVKSTDGACKTVYSSVAVCVNPSSSVTVSVTV